MAAEDQLFGNKGFGLTSDWLAVEINRCKEHSA
jgi:hypothetical protein